ncbi:MAG: hypothetical protein HY704_06140 [Gemmatimonadetes bacterium]|nr:hypothetical protein [Gemmatimonadota bacterium]
MRRNASIFVPALVAAALCGASGLRSQERDATTAAPGRLRIQVGPTFATFDRRFGFRMHDGDIIEEEEPLGFDFTKRDAGADLLPSLAPLERALREAAGDADARLTVGASRVVLDGSAVLLPFELAFGILSRLQVGVHIPLVRRRMDVDFRLDADSATVGLAQAASVQAFVSGFSSAVSATQARVSDECQTLGETSVECRSGRELVTRASAMLSGVRTAAGLLPLAGSAEAGALDQAIREIQDGMRRYGVVSFTAPAPLAREPLDAPAFQKVLTDPAFGIAGDSLGFWQSGWELGDIELSAKYRFAETPLADSAGAARPLAYRGAVSVAVRLGTGKLDDPSNFVDLGSGDGQRDIEFASYNDVLIAGRMLASVVVRYGIQSAAIVERRISPPDRPIVLAAALRNVEWTPANYLGVDALPQLVLTPAVSVGIPYSYFTKGKDTYARADGGAPADGANAVPPPDVLAEETESTYHRLGIGIVYSTPPGTARLPLEARAIYQNTVAGSGGRTLKRGTFQVEVRTGLTLWGK